jgi:hypothetical protein
VEEAGGNKVVEGDEEVGVELAVLVENDVSVGGALGDSDMFSDVLHLFLFSECVSSSPLRFYSLIVGKE